MASDTLGAEERREKPRWSENSKVYSRRIHRAKNNAVDNQKSDAVAATTTVLDENDGGVAQANEAAQTDNSVATVTAEDSNTVALPPASQSPPGKDSNSQLQPPNSLRSEVVSDDSSSLNKQHGGGVENGSAPNRPVVTHVDDRVNISLTAARSKQEARELKRKLLSDLEQVRILARKLEDKAAQVDVLDGGLIDSGDPVGGGVITSVGGQIHSVGINEARPFRRLTVSVNDNDHGAVVFEKEKRTPKANQLYQNSDYIYGMQRLPSAESNKKLKSNGKKKHGGGGGSAIDKKIFKKCATLLQKLMKHKHGWVFSAPVDVEGLGLHDYFDIIKQPMDLGTVKNKLDKNWYKSPLEFAEDVRLTFGNAMTYNPEGQDVHVMAVQLSDIFEQRWIEIEAEYNRKLSFQTGYSMPVYAPQALPTTPRNAPVYRLTKNLDRSRSFALPVEPMQKPVYGGLGRSQSFAHPSDPRPKPVYSTPMGRNPAPKKPKVNDPDKRDMTFEEKQKLSNNLQALPAEKLDNIVQIIKKRNSSLCQQDDEIEVDIDSVDTETLWELDRFVINYKKTLSKHKRKAELALQRAETQRAMQAANPAASRPEVPRETITDDTAVVPASAPVNEGKQADDSSTSSSSSSSSSDSGSSSSDSDSDSSSGSGSDV